jgi:hypothetical protein
MRKAKNMKILITFFVSTLFVLSGFAQYGPRQYGKSQTVTINFNGNGYGNSGFRIVMDGTTYSSNTNSNNGTWNRNTSNRYGDDDITINNVQAGQHSIQVYRLRNNNRNYGTPAPVYSSTFNLRQGFDVILDVRGNGQVQFSEKRSNNGYDRRDRNNEGRRDRDNGNNNNGGYNNGYPNGQYRTPMADYQFSQIYQNAKGKWFQSAKITAVRDAFNNTATYYSSYQITQLLQLISSESNRLELAKLSYRVVADPSNFTQVYSLFSNQSNRNELDRYVRGNRF